MQPKVRFARTSDGVSVAYWVHGTGPILVQTPLMKRAMPIRVGATILERVAADVFPIFRD